MTKFHNLRILRKIVTQWNEYKERKNQQRRNVYYIRSAMEGRPELAKPLKVIKNQLLAKAFNKLIQGAPQVYNDEQLAAIADDQYNYATQKKCFLALQLNTQMEAQIHQADEIAALFTKRRWLNHMKQGTAYLKDRRRQRNKASILRFLSLQKRAF